MATDENKKQDLHTNKKYMAATRKYVKYSGLAIQMGLIIALFAYIGVYLDKKFTQTQIFTAILALLGVLAALYTVIKQLSMDKKA